MRGNSYNTCLHSRKQPASPQPHVCFIVPSDSTMKQERSPSVSKRNKNVFETYHDLDAAVVALPTSCLKHNARSRSVIRLGHTLPSTYHHYLLHIAYFLVLLFFELILMQQGPYYSCSLESTTRRKSYNRASHNTG